MPVRFCPRQIADSISDRQEECRRAEGQREAGKDQRGLLSAQVWLSFSKRGTLNKTLNLSLPQNPLLLFISLGLVT